ncbi:MAG: hypothetical protein WCO03_00825 [bacterium]
MADQETKTVKKDINRHIVDTAKSVGRDVVVKGAIAGALGGPAAGAKQVGRSIEKSVTSNLTKAIKEKKTDPKKKLSGAGFFIVLLIMIIKDVFDLGADVSVVLAWISFVIEPLSMCILLFYYFIEGVSWNGKKIATTIASFIIGWVPFLNILPDATSNLLIMRWMENSDLAKSLIGKSSSDKDTEENTATKNKPQEEQTKTGSDSAQDNNQVTAGNQQKEQAQQQDKGEITQDNNEPPMQEPTPSPSGTRPAKTGSENDSGNKPNPWEEKSTEEAMGQNHATPAQGNQNQIKTQANLEASQSQDAEQQRVSGELAQLGVENLSQNDGPSARVLDMENPDEQDLDQYLDRDVA